MTPAYISARSSSLSDEVLSTIVKVFHCHCFRFFKLDLLVKQKVIYTG